MLVHRLNRVVLTLLGLVLTAAGVVGLLARNHSLDLAEPGTYYRRLHRNAVDHSDVWRYAVVGGAAVLALVAVFWFWRQLRPRSDGRIGSTLMRRTQRGRTSVEPVALARVVAQDLRLVPGVSAAKVRMVTLSNRPELVATVSIRDDADPDEVRAGAEGPFGRLCLALDVPAVEVDLRLRPTDEVAARVI